MPRPSPDAFNPDIDTGDFDPIDELEIEEALEETPEGNKKFKRLLLTDTRRHRKHCRRVTCNFHGRIVHVERKVFAWKYQLAGIVAACVVLIPIIGYLLSKVL